MRTEASGERDREKRAWGREGGVRERAKSEGVRGERSKDMRSREKSESEKKIPVKLIG